VRDEADLRERVDREEGGGGGQARSRQEGNEREPISVPAEERPGGKLDIGGEQRAQLGGGPTDIAFRRDEGIEGEAKANDTGRGQGKG